MNKLDMLELQMTIDRVKSGKTKYTNDGKVYQNGHTIDPSSQRLNTGSGPYTEWTVKTPDVGTNEKRRIVFDTQTNKAYL